MWLGKGFGGGKPPQDAVMEAYSSSEDFGRSILGQHSRRRRRQEREYAKTDLKENSHE